MPVLTQGLTRSVPPLLPQCEDTLDKVIVFKKGEIVDVPCHYEHKVRGLWVDHDRLALRPQPGS